MKKILFLLLLAVSTSCTDGDDQPQNFQLSGEWTLINIECFCGFDESIDINDFKLTFEDSGNIVHLENPTEDYFYIAESGTYNYDLEGNEIIIDGADSYTYKIKESSLILTLIDDPAIADDELILTYQRN